MIKLILRLFRLLSSRAEMSSEKLLTMNEGNIRAIFRAARSKLVKSHTALKNSLTNILVIVQEVKEKKEVAEKQIKKKKEKIKEVNLEKKESSKLKISNLKTQIERLEGSLGTYEKFIEKNKNVMEKYTCSLLKIQSKIDEIEFNENQTVSDIELAKSTKMINSLSSNDVDYSNEDLAIIERARKRAVMAMNIDDEIQASV